MVWSIQVGWDDVPHLTEEAKQQLYESYPPHERDARAKGVPMLGVGRIFPIPEELLIVDPFEIPIWWPRAYGLDVGWNRTAAIWGAHDRDSDIVYLYSEHYIGQQAPQLHVDAIKQRGEHLVGAIDPGAAGANQLDGRTMIGEYRRLGLNLVEADNAVEAGIHAMYRRMASGRLKVFRTLGNWIREFRIYRRDDNGKVVKENDHLMDACVVGKTTVCTPHGPMRIDSLVGRSGTVYSRDGSRCSFVGAKKTKSNAQVVRVDFNDGRSVTCTPDHPFLTPSGWIRADDMIGHKCYDGVTQSIKAKSCASQSFRTRFRNSRAGAIISAASIFNGTAIGFIARYGRQSTGSPSRMDTMFTMPMKTVVTISRKISSSCRGQHIQAIIRSVMGARQPMLLFQELRSGTLLNAGESGIAGITKKSDTNFMSGLKSNASIAANAPAFEIPARIASVPTHAGLTRAWRLALTMRNATAWCAARLSWSIAIARNPAVRESVLRRCVSVKEAGKRDVYCLTVPATSSFCVEGGLVVHNTRYYMMTGMDYAMWTQEFDEEAIESPAQLGRSGVTGY